MLPVEITIIISKLTNKEEKRLLTLKNAGVKQR